MFPACLSLRCAALAAALLLWFAVPASAAGRKPNILLIVADDLGYGELSIQGNKQIPTPNIDSIARNGIRFTSGYVSGPYCSPTRAGLLTGRYQQRFGHEFNPGPPQRAQDVFGLSLQETTLAERLKPLGYATGMFGKWHLGYQPRFQPQKRGFDAYYGFLGGAHSYLDALSDSDNPILEGTTPVKEIGYTTDAFAQKAVEFIEKNHDRPWLVYLPFNAVHAPLQASPKYLSRFPNIEDRRRRTFAAMLSAMDDGVGQVLAKLREHKLEEDTLIFFVSDNGGPTRITTCGNGPLRGFKAQTWEGGVRVPFMVQWKGHLPGGKVDDRPVIQLDILPTTLAAVGEKIRPEWKLDGVNLLPYLQGKQRGAPHPALYWRFGKQMAIRMGDWKLVKAPGIADTGQAEDDGGANTTGAALYNLKNDLGEQTNLADKEPGKVAELAAAWNRWNAELMEPRWRPRRAANANAGAAVLSPVGLTQAAPSGKPQRPNIIFIFSDDHAYQAVSAYGSRLNRTPNLDRIASEGMRFDRCLVTNSLCGPSRACILTGKYSHLNGFYNNTNSRFDGTQTTFPKLLQQAGYQTAIIGKWHLVSDPTGFDEWEILPGQGVYYNPILIHNGQQSKQPGYVTDIITERSLAWLKSRDPSRPFLLMCQHKAPHREWSPSLDKLSLYDGVTFPEPPTLFDDYANRGKAEHAQDMRIGRTMTGGDLKLMAPAGLTPKQKQAWDAYYEPRNEAFRKANLTGKDLVRWKYQRYMHDYLACIASVDDSVGKLLDYLRETGLDKNTLVVYASDQGFYLGEHGWFDKRWIFEESLRTPLLVRWPGVIKPGSVNRDLVSNLDFAETFLEAAGVTVPADMQGRSLLPLLRGKTPKDWRTAFYYHYYEYPAVHSVARHYGVVTDRYKLVHFYEPEFDYWELFDLKKDPREQRSVYGQPEYAKTQQELEKALTRLRAELKVPAQDPPETDLRPARRLLSSED